MWGVGCARLRRAGEGAGAGERAERAERDSIADGTALRCGRVGSRHFERVPLGTLFFLRLPYSSTLQCSTEGTDVYCRVVLINYYRSDVAVSCARDFRERVFFLRQLARHLMPVLLFPSVSR